MGRERKYFTNAERVAAKRAQHANYARSDRGKATRARSRSKHALLNGSIPTTHCNVSIPPAAYTRASTHIPVSWYLEEEGPNLGLRQSPYCFVLPDATALDALEDVSNDLPALLLNSLQYNWARADGAARFQAWSKPGSDEAELAELAVAELRERIYAWNTLVSEQPGTKESGSYVEEVYLDWGAKRIVWLAQELEVRQKGLEAYRTAHRQGELPVQILYQEQTEPMDTIPLSYA